ncbi:MAG: T9SS type A sorting domain-containing protein [Chitinophagaceae bacterium]|nr:T9SS type A sorting domain-containing protein [Chitinophagaceae bacterium]
MRKCFLLLLVMTSLSAISQVSDPELITGRLVRKTMPLGIMPDTDPAFKPKVIRDENGLIGFPKKTPVIKPFQVNAPGVVDPVLQHGNEQNRVEAISATIGTNVNGMGYTSVNPSDPVITAGPNHIIQMINSGSGALMKIFNKDGSQVIAQKTFSTITGVQGIGDPILQYDKLANRWLLTEFGYSNGVTSYVNTLVLAVSATEDPLGSWYVYAFADMTFFVDFPKFAVWGDGYYATSNDFNTAGTAYLGSSVYAFDRTSMLAGAPTAAGIRTRLTHADGRFFSMAPVTVEGPLAPPGGSKAMFMYYTDDAGTADPADVDSIYMFTMTPDFVTPANTVISAPTRFVPAAFDEVLCTATRGRCIDQQTNTTLDLEDLAGRFSNRIVYRNFGTHEGILCNLTVDADGLGKGGIRWMELRKTAGWGIYQEGTWAPDANERWLGSLDYDAIGNIALAYNVSGTTANPSIRFTGRNACDPLGTMTLTETTIVAGTASNGSNRYGDYNSLVIDPATDRDFWFTAQHNSGATTWNTRITQITLNNCTPLTKVRFSSNEFLAYEDSLKTAGTGCQLYKDYTTNVVIDAAPSQPAIVTFTTGGTATLGSDYTITPASVTVSSGTLSVPVTIRVFSDDNIEGTETISLGYTINAQGGNATADTYNQSCVIKVIDNDNSITIQQNASLLLAEGFGTAAAPGTSSGTWTVINPNTATNTWVYSANGGTGITTGAAHITNNVTTNPLTYTVTVSDTATLRSPLVDASGIPAVGGDSLKLFIRYKSNGELFSGTYYDFGRLRYSLDGTNFITIPGTPILQGVTALTDLTVALPASLKGQQFYIGYYWQNDNSAGTQPPFTLDSTSVYVSAGKIESAAASTATAYITSVQPVNFISSADGELIGTIKNSGNIGCITASVPVAGNGRTAATINSAPANRSNKVIQITPANAYSGNYTVTLYFTAAELAVWGGSAVNLRILKVADADPLGATITGQIFPASVSDNLATRGYISYTATCTGFSKFMLTDAPATVLAVSDLQFTAAAQRTNILLNWSTRTETENRGFNIERSTDGRNFSTLSFVAGVGNSTVLSRYQYADNTAEPGVLYYYRLRQTDLNGYEHLSDIRKAKINSKQSLLLINPNPASDVCRLQIPELQANCVITVTDNQGRVVIRKTSQSLTGGGYDLDISKLAPAVYTIKVVTGKMSYTGKLVKH